MRRKTRSGVGRESVRSPLAVSALAITAASTSVAVPVELAWFAPVLVIKLLLAHLLPEEAER
ncbi:hypothetical protein TK78_05090 [Streptomyces sp. Tue 6075]|uniref:hypothetical protein n=1 Tax=Streptomyces sp. Tue 6075 TaxID=1661694 RepID=UPI00094A81E1|nr:hypothetical protein [Streptomyces sp. Tue 6075]APS18397.1 hypothetical protein TK78_05090 [Streptomyces sp. Tue 6075]